MKNPFKKKEAMEEKDLKEDKEQTQQQETTETITETDAESEKMKALQQQLQESQNKYLYLFSDFENYKRHAARDRNELVKTAGRDILTALLPVLDDFDRASKNTTLDEGIVLIHNKLLNILESKELKLLSTKPGDDFNADLHEAVAEIPAASEAMKGKIVDILEQGYTLNDRIIRFAKVVVGN
jgi:molecular chaperone GrpE